MKCFNCGTELANGSISCHVCGAQVQNRQYYGQVQNGQYQGGYQQNAQGYQTQQNYSMPQGYYQQPYANVYQPRPKSYFYPGGSFSQRIKSDFTMLFSLLGAFLLFLSAVIPAWVHLKFAESANYWTEKVKYGTKNLGLFSSYKSDDVFSMLMPGIFKISAVAIIILSLWLLIKYMVSFNIIAGANLTKITGISGNEWHGPIVLALIFIYITFDGAVQSCFDAAKASSLDLPSLGVTVMRTEMSFGVSWWFALIGLVFLFVRPLVYAMKRQNFYTGVRK